MSVDEYQPPNHVTSVSSLKSLTGCGERFRLEKMVSPRLPRVPAAWSIVGTAFHAAYEAWERNGRIDQVFYDSFEDGYLALIQDELAKTPEEGWQNIPGRSFGWTIEHYRKRMLDKDIPGIIGRIRFEDWLPAEIDGGPALEVPYEMEIAGEIRRGIIDRIERWSDGRYTVTDLKTGKPKDHLDHRQLGDYGYAARTIFGLNVEWGRYWFSRWERGNPIGQIEWVDLTRYTKEYLDEVYANADQLIRDKVFLANPGERCELCSVKRWCREMGTEEWPPQETENMNE